MITLPSSRADSFTFRPVPPGVKWSWMSASMTSLTEPRSAATVPILSRTLSSRNLTSFAYADRLSAGGSW